MANTAFDLNCGLRPHMKTHKTLEIGALMAPDKKEITVSTLAEAEFFANGTDDHFFCLNAFATIYIYIN